MGTEADEAEVRQRIATDCHYPLGEHDAMKWAIAFRVRFTEGERGVPIPLSASELDSRMVGWFANCMATEEMLQTGGSFLNADGVQSIIDGEIEAHPELHR